MRSAPTGEERVRESYIAWTKRIVDLLVRPERAAKAQVGNHIFGGRRVANE